ncbi:ABC transporter ATP-binding protein [Bacillus methanolicus]|uniref:Iron(3+)-hydroxamate import ATP-binding protein FhuC n=1 Tax=Bacillus methanolicus (strain MGA3 / ATCC 53907) TaxID=796606 RepID=I3EBV0_BACMM|nr:ABC transporter ATP-binding protein [Bacillus methanolicus]AIE61650.1 Iron(3+)-hydroxamate import ATP-binding protein FhuC [Bacillus methanolicus MGA3]EIJ83971.1 FhuC [Bacillus methanolicus MGA3]
MTTLAAEQLTIGYEDRIIVERLNLEIPSNQITAIIGPNGCGKSTILKTVARLHPALSSVIYLDGKMIHKIPTKEVAKKLAILPQSPEAPSGLTVYELISYGRTPYQTGFSRLSKHDYEMIEWALEVTGLTNLRDQSVDTLSGGQRQRAWIAMAIAQETNLLLLDEPTTYLDLAHQLEVLQLLEKLNQEDGRTIAMVIHDLNHAARFAHHMVALKNGTIVKQGTPEKVMTAEVLKQVFNIDTVIVTDPRTRKPAMISYDLLK